MSANAGRTSQTHNAIPYVALNVSKFLRDPAPSFPAPDAFSASAGHAAFNDGLIRRTARNRPLASVNAAPIQRSTIWPSRQRVTLA